MTDPLKLNSTQTPAAVAAASASASQNAASRSLAPSETSSCCSCCESIMPECIMRAFRAIADFFASIWNWFFPSESKPTTALVRTADISRLRAIQVGINDWKSKGYFYRLLEQRCQVTAVVKVKLADQEQPISHEMTTFQLSNDNFEGYQRAIDTFFLEFSARLPKPIAVRDNVRMCLIATSRSQTRADAFNSKIATYTLLNGGIPRNGISKPTGHTVDYLDNLYRQEEVLEGINLRALLKLEELPPVALAPEPAANAEVLSNGIPEAPALTPASSAARPAAASLSPALKPVPAPAGLMAQLQTAVTKPSLRSASPAPKKEPAPAVSSELQAKLQKQKQQAERAPSPVPVQEREEKAVQKWVVPKNLAPIKTEIETLLSRETFNRFKFPGHVFMRIYLFKEQAAPKKFADGQACGTSFKDATYEQYLTWMQDMIRNLSLRFQASGTLPESNNGRSLQLISSHKDEEACYNLTIYERERSASGFQGGFTEQTINGIEVGQFCHDKKIPSHHDIIGYGF